ncbi:DUF4037 domain-containing protein [Paenibacillus tengchongensis]|uniref:DUF4037 domain-containing protein n=1 Tax=Paenibacillus tengchongensis TaxID=2608684 RepID=UPI00124D82D8|nr:DUF4037 domain-containing protein [Paenibacillus tengchongensis]
MSTAVTRYFDHAVMPVIRKQFPEAVPEMSLMILGSVGLGIDDPLSDLEAAVYLPDDRWKAYGGQLQLSLNGLLARTNPWKQEGSVISVLPVSWLLDGKAQAFLEGSGDLPWESVSFESLFTVQYNRIVHDPQGILHRLRSATAPSLYPEPLWKKSILRALQQLIAEDYAELRSCVLRERLAEAHLIYGRVIEGLFRLGFAVFHRYYPWRTHLRWAFGELPDEAAGFTSALDELAASERWNERVEIIAGLITSYKAFITGHMLLPEVNLYSGNPGEELLWAERLSAWEHPQWRNWIDDCSRKAVQNGYSAEQFWVWSLWGWNKEADQ